MYRLIAPGMVDVGIMRNKSRDTRTVGDRRSEVSMTFNDTMVA